MQNANLVANEVHNRGFRARVLFSTCVEVSLNRPVTVDEVETVLDSIFGEISFNCTRLLNGAVLVKWEL